jgi:hypothetical protein
MCRIADKFKNVSIGQSKNRTVSMEDRALIEGKSRMTSIDFHPAPESCTLINKEYLDISLVIKE